MTDDEARAARRLTERVTRGEITVPSEADFADCLIAAASTAAGCGAVYSFDKAAIRNAGMTQVP